MNQNHTPQCLFLSQIKFCLISLAPQEEEEEEEEDNINTGITLISFNELRDQNLANYSELIGALVEKAKDTFEKSKIGSYLLFGMAGTGKTGCIKQSAWILNVQHHISCSYIKIDCKKIKARTHNQSEDIDRLLEEGMNYVKFNRPVIVVLDELDQLAPVRIGHTETTSTIMGLLDGDFDKQVKEEGKLVFVGVTNEPKKIDDAVRERIAESTFYLRLPTLEIICEILSINKVPVFKEVGSEIVEQLGDDMISPKSLKQGCVKARHDCPGLFNNPKMEFSAREIRDIATAILGAHGYTKSRYDVEDYISRNDSFIKAARRNLGYRDLLRKYEGSPNSGSGVSSVKNNQNSEGRTI